MDEVSDSRLEHFDLLVPAHTDADTEALFAGTAAEMWHNEKRIGPPVVD